MDRREQKTEAAIFAAFDVLLAKKQYEKITVQEIIAAANIGRSTFYAHFETRDELLRRTCARLFAHILENRGESGSGHDFSRAPQTPAAFIAHILHHLQENRSNLAAILACGNNAFLQELLTDCLRQMLRLQPAGGQPGLPPQAFLLNHLACSFTAMLQWWAKNKLRQTPEQMAAYFMTLIAPVLSPGGAATTKKAAT